MQLLPMASSPDGLINAWYAVITKTPGWEVLTTTSNAALGGGGGSGRGGLDWIGASLFSGGTSRGHRPCGPWDP